MAHSTVCKICWSNNHLWAYLQSRRKAFFLIVVVIFFHLFIFKCVSNIFRFIVNMVRAWYMDNETTDQRLEHHRNPPKFLDLDELFKKTGVEYFPVIFHWKYYISECVIKNDFVSSFVVVECRRISNWWEIR